ncbi:MAG TPA: hypothetical protein ENI80_11760 [Acidiferrobacteraceae bacterium]|nr:hypothetical protein [Acidiferrobacteraceae bacterium]
MFKNVLFVAALGIFCTDSAIAKESAQSWLMRMHQAAKTVSYEGTFVYLHDNRIETMQVVHESARGLHRERLFSLNGEAREIIRDKDQVWCYLPNRKMGVHEYRRADASGFPAVRPVRIDGLKESYDLKLGAQDRIAGRPVQLLIVKPKDEFRYGYRFWVDIEYGLLLKVDLVGKQERAVEQYMFTHIVVKSKIDDEQFAPATPKADLVWHGDEKKPPPPNSPSGWTAQKLPKGYQLTSNISRHLPIDNVPIEHLVYSDGISSVSVFIEKLQPGGAKPMIGLSHMGAISAFGVVMDGYQITVVGEVPTATVDYIGRSMSRTN